MYLFYVRRMSPTLIGEVVLELLFPCTYLKKGSQYHVAKRNNTRPKNRIKDSFIDRDLVAQYGLEFQLPVIAVRSPVRGAMGKDERRRSGLYYLLMTSDN